jgi:hypothetical protein
LSEVWQELTTRATSSEKGRRRGLIIPKVSDHALIHKFL